MISIPDLLGCLYQTKVKTAAKPMGSHFLMTDHFPPGKVYVTFRTAFKSKKFNVLK